MKIFSKYARLMTIHVLNMKGLGCTAIEYLLRTRLS